MRNSTSRPSAIITAQLLLEDSAHPIFQHDISHPLVRQDGQDCIDVQDFTEQLIQDIFYPKSFYNYDECWLTCECFLSLSTLRLLVTDHSPSAEPTTLPSYEKLLWCLAGYNPVERDLHPSVKKV
jgi:hypothetical protein